MKQDLMYFNLNSCYLFFTKLIHIPNFLRYQRGLRVVRLLILDSAESFKRRHIELLEIWSHPEPNCLACGPIWLAKKTE